MTIWIYAVAAVASTGAVILGVANFGGGAQAQNVTLEAPSGAALVADDSLLLVDIRTHEEWKQRGVVDGAIVDVQGGMTAFWGRGIGP